LSERRLSYELWRSFCARWAEAWCHSSRGITEPSWQKSEPKPSRPKGRAPLIRALRISGLQSRPQVWSVSQFPVQKTALRSVRGRRGGSLGYFSDSFEQRFRGRWTLLIPSSHSGVPTSRIGQSPPAWRRPPPSLPHRCDGWTKVWSCERHADEFVGTRKVGPAAHELRAGLIGMDLFCPIDRDL